MKATMEIPDELYRQVKAKSALEGRPVREVAVELFQRYVSPDEPSELGREARDPGSRHLIDGEPAPKWFAALRRSAQGAKRHELEAIRGSIARGIMADRGL